MDKKICIKCNVEEARQNYSYCSKCYLKYKRKWDNDNREHLKIYRRKRICERAKNTIYMFVNEDKEILYIGSTSNIKSRVSQHFNLHTDISKKLKLRNIKYDIIYSEIDNLENREELFFIEYYLIHKHYIICNDTLLNVRSTFHHNICTSRQFELILIAENLKFKNYDLLQKC